MDSVFDLVELEDPYLTEKNQDSFIFLITDELIDDSLIYRYIFVRKL